MKTKKSQASKIKSQKKPKPQISKLKTSAITPLICLLGDEQLVKEYSVVFQENGIAVQELKNLSSLKTSSKKITHAFELSIISNDQKKKNLAALDASLPEQVPIVSCTLTETLLSQTQHLQRRERFIGIAAFPTLLNNSLVELAPSLYTEKAIADNVTALIVSIKKEAAMVQDSIGMVMPRILCQIINEALFAVQYDIATPNDIDEAMKYGTNYPRGPIAWGEMIGFSNVVAVLDALYHNHHEERYRVAPLLRQMATAGVFWKEKLNT